MKQKQIGIGLLGFGNVGKGTYQVLEMNRDSIRESSGLDFRVTKILVRDKTKDREIDLPDNILTEDPNDILLDPDIAIVVELLGGVNPASKMMLGAMERGKHVVTANKAAVAANFSNLKNAANANGVMIRYEASVCGGIPILNAISSLLSSNEILEIKGILNGTTNYILTQMTENGLAYHDALLSAQEKGFAEADPTDDVQGIDAANKLSILMSLAFGKTISPLNIPTIGIAGVTKEEIEKATDAQKKIKLIATARKTSNGIECGVGPEAIPRSHPLAGVNNEFNAVFVEGNAVGELMFYGRGAGPFPTGSAVLGDIVEIGKAIAKNAAFDTSL